MLFDTHVHIGNFETPCPERVLESMRRNGVDKTALFSEEPAYYERDEIKLRAFNRARLDRLLAWCAGSDGQLLPIYFIDPTEPEALEQVETAIEAGCVGFKVICETFYPGDARAMPVYRRIAERDKAILFHSGTLWDFGENDKYNRPSGFDALLYVPRLRFALAHIGWPWCDETVAMYGKYQAMAWHAKYTGQKMYIDMTPGTPSCYRREALSRLIDVGYDHMTERLLFGTDQFTGEYDAREVAALREADDAIFRSLGLDEQTRLGIFGGNALEFWGI